MKSTNNGLSVQSWRRQLDEYASVHLASIHGQDLIHITANDSSSLTSCMNGLAIKPISDSAPLGWGEPFTGDGIGTPGGDNHDNLFTYEEGISNPVLTRGYDFSDYPINRNEGISNWRLFTYYKSGLTYLTWPMRPVVGSSTAVTAATRYSCTVDGSTIYSCGKALTSSPDTVCGVCVYDGELYAAGYYHGGSTLLIYKRTLRREYIDDGMFNANSNPDGWKLVLTYTLPEIHESAVGDLDALDYSPRFYGVVAGSATTGKMAVLAGKGYYSTIHPVGHVEIDLASGSASYMGRTTIGAVIGNSTGADEKTYTSDFEEIREYYPSGRILRYFKTTEAEQNKSESGSSSVGGYTSTVCMVDYDQDQLLTVKVDQPAKASSGGSSTIWGRDSLQDTYYTDTTPNSKISETLIYNQYTSGGGHSSGNQGYSLQGSLNIDLFVSSGAVSHNFAGTSNTTSGPMNVTGMHRTGSDGFTSNRYLALDLRTDSALLEKTVSNVSENSTRDYSSYLIYSTDTRSIACTDKVRGTELKSGGFENISTSNQDYRFYPDVDQWRTPYYLDMFLNDDSNSSSLTTYYRDYPLLSIGYIFGVLGDYSIIPSGTPHIDYEGEIFTSHGDVDYDNSSSTLRPTLTYSSYYNYYGPFGINLDSVVGITGNNARYRDICLI